MTERERKKKLYVKRRKRKDCKNENECYAEERMNVKNGMRKKKERRRDKRERLIMKC